MPKPTALEVYEGRPSHRPLSRNEPRPREIIPIAPEHLDEIGHAFYERVIQVMTPVTGWLTEADFAAAGELANWYAIYRKADAMLKEHGNTYVTAFMDSSGQEHKQIKAFPEVKMRKDAWVEVLKLMDRLGLSPGARARMVLSKRENEDDDLDSN